MLSMFQDVTELVIAVLVADCDTFDPSMSLVDVRRGSFVVYKIKKHESLIPKDTIAIHPPNCRDEYK